MVIEFFTLISIECVQNFPYLQNRKYETTEGSCDHYNFGGLAIEE